MTRFVLVHGAWHGGWCWRRVARTLSEAGHEVWTPTLTGLGERSHLLHRDVGLATHVEDVAAVLRHEELDDVVLVGHSYGGLVVRGVADALPAAIRKVLLLDGWVCDDGESLHDRAPSWFSDMVDAAAVAQGDGWRIPVPPVDLLGVEAPEDRAWLEAHLTPQPYLSFVEPASLSGAVDDVPAAAIVCAPGSGLPFDDWAKAIGCTDVMTVDAGHDAMVVAPAAVAGLLESLA